MFKHCWLAITLVAALGAWAVIPERRAPHRYTVNRLGMESMTGFMIPFNREWIRQEKRELDEARKSGAIRVREVVIHFEDSGEEIEMSFAEFERRLRGCQ